MTASEDSRTPGFHVVAEYLLAEGTEEEVLGDIARLADASRAEPGNISYEYFRNVEQPGHVVIVERYVDEDAFDAHLSSEHFQTIGTGEIAPRLRQRTVRTFSGTGQRS